MTIQHVLLVVGILTTFWSAYAIGTVHGLFLKNGRRVPKRLFYLFWNSVRLSLQGGWAVALWLAFGGGLFKGVLIILLLWACWQVVFPIMVNAAREQPWWKLSDRASDKHPDHKPSGWDEFLRGVFGSDQRASTVQVLVSILLAAGSAWLLW